MPSLHVPKQTDISTRIRLGVSSVSWKFKQTDADRGGGGHKTSPRAEGAATIKGSSKRPLRKSLDSKVRKPKSGEHVLVDFRTAAGVSLEPKTTFRI